MHMRDASMAKLEVTDPLRAKLARLMLTYLNHLDGMAARGELAGVNLEALRVEERILEHRLGAL